MSAPTPQDIAGQYKVESHDGTASVLPMTVELKAIDKDSVQVHAKVANSLNGKWTLTDGVYKGMLMSTRMMGPPEMMKIEGFLSTGSMEGLQVVKDGNKLVLTHGESKVVLAPQ